MSSNLKLDKVKEGVAGFAPKVCLPFTPSALETELDCSDMHPVVLTNCSTQMLERVCCFVKNALPLADSACDAHCRGSSCRCPRRRSALPRKQRPSSTRLLPARPQRLPQRPQVRRSPCKL